MKFVMPFASQCGRKFSDFVLKALTFYVLTHDFIKLLNLPASFYTVLRCFLLIPDLFVQP